MINKKKWGGNQLGVMCMGHGATKTPYRMKSRTPYPYAHGSQLMGGASPFGGREGV